MRLTEQQAQMLYQIAMDSIRKNVVGMFTMTMEVRVKLLNEILSQQDNEIMVDMENTEEGGTLV